MIATSPIWLKSPIPLSRRNRNCWPKSEKAEPSEVASRTFLDQPKKISKIIEVDAIRLEALKAIHDVLDL